MNDVHPTFLSFFHITRKKLIRFALQLDQLLILDKLDWMTYSKGEIEVGNCYLLDMNLFRAGCRIVARKLLFHSTDFIPGIGSKVLSCNHQRAVVFCYDLASKLPLDCVGHFTGCRVLFAPPKTCHFYSNLTSWESSSGSRSYSSECTTG